MADHAPAQYATAAGNDLPAHRAMYERFVHLVFIGAAYVANIVIGLAIGAITGHWLVAFAIFVVGNRRRHTWFHQRRAQFDRGHGDH